MLHYSYIFLLKYEVTCCICSSSSTSSLLIISFGMMLYQLYFGFCAAVVTAVTELGHGKPQFYSTPEVISFCRKWRLPTNHVWLFSTRCPSDNFMCGRFSAYSVWLPCLTQYTFRKTVQMQTLIYAHPQCLTWYLHCPFNGTKGGWKTWYNLFI